jgi:hypothetical protein
MHNGAIMPTEVQHRVDADEPYPVVRLTGVLDANTSAQVRSVLLTGLAEQPAAMIIDVSALRAADQAAVGVLRDVARVTADWPRSHLVLCARPGTEAVWGSTGLPIWPTTEEAVRAIGESTSFARLDASLQPVVGAARRSRELVTEACARWDLPELAGPGCIVVTELVNNVVAHAHSGMTVRLALHRDGNLTIAVQDASPAAPSFTGRAAPTAYGGRGLLLVDSVARQWGSLSLDGGKVVWAVLHPEDEASGSGSATATAARDTR